MQHGIVGIVDIISTVLHPGLTQGHETIAHEQLVEVCRRLHAAQVLRILFEKVGRAGRRREQQCGDKKWNDLFYFILAKHKALFHFIHLFVSVKIRTECSCQKRSSDVRKAGWS